MNILKRILFFFFEDEIETFRSFQKTSLLNKIKILFVLFLILFIFVVLGISYLLNHIPIINWIFDYKLMLRLMNIIEKLLEQIDCIIDKNIEYE